ncbi:MAG: hypothetical protein ACE3JK_12565 [Sporolactobacillus sp.]
MAGMQIRILHFSDDESVLKKEILYEFFMMKNDSEGRGEKDACKTFGTY